MSQVLHTEPLTAEAFAPFGEVLEAKGEPAYKINQGRCTRFHDRGRIEVVDGRAGISLFKAEPQSLPYRLEMMERHPHGSQAFIPMSLTSFLVIVAPDADGKPGVPRAFVSAEGQGVNLARGCWHGVLTALSPPGLFAIVDRIGDSPNLEEYWFDTPWSVEH
jgi:ureidoglycolate lyase